MIYHNTPNQFIRYVVIAVNNPVSGSDNFLCIVKHEIFVFFSNPVYCFTHNFQIALNSSFCLYIAYILLKNTRLVILVAFNLIDGLQNIKKPGFNLVIHKFSVLRSLWIFLNMDFLKLSLRANQWVFGAILRAKFLNRNSYQPNRMYLLP